jgi:hypothetical protein
MRMRECSHPFCGRAISPWMNIEDKPAELPIRKRSRRKDGNKRLDHKFMTFVAHSLFGLFQHHHQSSCEWHSALLTSRTSKTVIISVIRQDKTAFTSSKHTSVVERNSIQDSNFSNSHRPSVTAPISYRTSTFIRTCTTSGCSSSAKDSLFRKHPPS